MDSYHLENLDLVRRIILNWILKKQHWKTWTDKSGSEKGQVAGSFKRGNEPSGS
jgi:hypothetical protein